jgi:hypothetical protein
VRSGSTIDWKTVNEGTGIQHHAIEGVDARSFVQLSYKYAKDAHRVYYNGSVLPGADPATFKLVSTDYAVDANHAFYEMFTMWSAEVGTFRTFGDSEYARDAHTVFHKNQPMETCDIDTFVVLKGWWEKDAVCVYERNLFAPQDKRAEGADPRTFVVLSDTYGKDASNVFVHGHGKIADADVATFRSESGGMKGRDKNSCYVYDQRAPC